MKNPKPNELQFLLPEEIGIYGEDDHPLNDFRAGLPVLESLVVDIMLHGIVEPVVIGIEDGRPWVIDGRQRVKAATEANRRLAAKNGTLVRVPCVFRLCDRVGAYAASIAANEHRQGDDPMTKAKKVERFFALGGDEEEAAIAFGVHTRTIRNWLELLTLWQAAQKAVQSGALSPTAALPIAKLPVARQNEAVAGLKAAKPEGRATVREAKAAAKGDVNAPRRRMRGRAELSLVRMHHPAELRKMNGVTTLRWVLGELDLPELYVPGYGVAEAIRTAPEEKEG